MCDAAGDLDQFYSTLLAIQLDPEGFVKRFNPSTRKHLRRVVDEEKNSLFVFSKAFDLQRAIAFRQVEDMGLDELRRLTAGLEIQSKKPVSPPPLQQSERVELASRIQGSFQREKRRELLNRARALERLSLIHI